jgi:cullin 1
LNHLSHGIVKTQYPLPLNVNYEIQVSTFQISILLLFNEVDKLTVGSIQKEIHLSTNELKNALLILLQSKILISNQMSELNMETEISLNFQFKSPNRKLLLFSNYQKKKFENSLNSTYEQINEDRKYSIQGVIVRIMKNRKVLSHNELISECINFLKNEFSPQISEIKRNINSLIETEYLKRDEIDSSIYQYIA